MTPAQDNPSQLRALFDAVCDLPQSQWRPRLESLTHDRAAIDEVIALLQAQTVSFNHALRPLAALMDSLPEAELQVGDRLGQWQLVERLASGGMGTVFVAERVDQLFRQRVAIKLLRGMGIDARVAQRLAEERRILAGLEHPGIARLFDGGTTPSGHPYLVMEYIDGLPLDAHCERHGLGVRERLQLFLRVCRAVQAAHQRLVIHCDLKPSNILVRDEVAPVLLDFGIAQVLGQGDGGDPAVFCTPAYASPEQLAGGRVGVTSDVFSLGVLLVELLARTASGRGIADRDRPVPSPSALAGDPRLSRALRGDLDAIAAKACALDPEQRYPSVGALARDIERHLAHRPVEARPRRARYLAGRWLRRHWRMAVATAAVLALAGGFVWRLGEARDRALAESAKSRAVLEFMGGLFELADPEKARGREVTAQDLLGRGIERMRGQFADRPEVRAELLGAMANAQRGLGRYDEALPLAEEAAALARGIGDATLYRAQELAHARLLHELGRYPEALAALDALEPRLRARDRDTRLARAALDHQRGRALQALNRRGEALAAYESAHRTRLQLLGAGDRATQDVAKSLVSLHVLEGRMADAERLARATLAEVRRHAAPRDPALAEALGALAMVLTNTGPIAEAEALRREELALRTAIYGAGHPDTVGAANNLAAALYAQQRYAEAAALFRRVLAQRRAQFGDGHPGVATVANNLAACELESGHAARAQALAEEALRIRLATYGPRHHATVASLHTLGAIELERNDARALEHLRQAVENASAAGANAGSLAGPLRDLARAKVLFGIPDPGCATAERALALAAGAGDAPGKLAYVRTIRAACAAAAGDAGADRALHAELAALRRLLKADDLRLRRADDLARAASR